MTYVLWILQILLALLFLMAGGTKLVMSLEQMQGQGPVIFPLYFLRFIGVLEVLGGLGLILPTLLRIKPGLTPLAAAGLIIIMIGATIVTVMTMGAAQALVPFVVGLLALFIAYGRWRLAPIRERA